MFKTLEVLEIQSSDYPTIKDVAVVEVLAEDFCIAEGYDKASDEWVCFELQGSSTSFKVISSYRY